jgi:hypothetical protein
MTSSAYRSRSVTKKHETDNSSLADFIERDNRKILSAGSVQLFISTPQLDKWFKSSTGTVCFIKDGTKKSSYYFSLYSLMQGQLWEQEVQAPFTYKKLSLFFHYLSVIRFNYGFKFLCEDEAERFLSVVKKYSTENVEITLNTNTPDQVDSRSAKKETDSKKFQTSTPIGVSIFAKKKSPAGKSDIKAIDSVSSETISSSNGSQASPVTPPYTPSSRRSTSTYSERQRKIDKSEISCPFRCSCTDLHLNSTNAPVNSMPPNLPNLKRVQIDLNCKEQKQEVLSNYTTISPSKNKGNTILETTTAISNSSNLKYSSVKNITQRALSSSSAQVNQNLHESLKEHKMKRSKFFTGSVSSLTSSSESQSSCKANTPNPKEIAIKVPQNLEIKRKQVVTQTLSEELAEELEITKQILTQYNVPINRKITRVLRDYICQYGSVLAFNNAIQQADEKSKLNAFIASSCAAIYYANQSHAENSPRNLSKFETIYPTTPYKATSNIPIKVKPVTQQQHTPLLMQNKIITNLNVHRKDVNSLLPMSKQRSNSFMSVSNPGSRLATMPTAAALKSVQHHKLNLHHQRTHQLNQYTSDDNSNADAPPKPPRRPTQKINSS